MALYCIHQCVSQPPHWQGSMNREQSAGEPAFICPSCSLIMQAAAPSPHHGLKCPRCAKNIFKYRRNSLEKTLAYSCTGLLLFLPAVSLPLLTLSVLGLESSSSLAGTVSTLFHEHDYLVGSVVLYTAIFAPLCILAILFLVCLGIIRQWPRKPLAALFRLYHHLYLYEWAMTDVFLIGIFITTIKMKHSSTITFDIGFFCFTGLVLMILAAQSTASAHVFWELLAPSSSAPASYRVTDNQLPAPPILCYCCHKVIPSVSSPLPKTCTRCGSVLYRRKKNSISRTWAFLLTAVIFSFPANMLPIMEVESFGIPAQSTILDGILYFFREGSYGIGLIIFTASILVPLFKISGLSILLLSIQLNWKSWLRHKTIMMRCIQFIGRWSMLDIFVITLLSALVRFNYLSSIQAAPAALYFTGVVICTMLAATTFDIRLIWDSTERLS
ncbi:MAG: hypothetical protein CSA33_06595 [Desulfobulbus propionicus]|nr:MAG: hypothetical protein CSA33_06595 [Desulfobulbus propionicus]